MLSIAKFDNFAKDFNADGNNVNVQNYGRKSNNVVC
jgi:hypothetical protein